MSAKPMQTLYVVVDTEEGTHHGTFDDVSVARDEARTYQSENGYPPTAVFAYRRGKQLHTFPSQEPQPSKAALDRARAHLTDQFKDSGPSASSVERLAALLEEFAAERLSADLEPCRCVGSGSGQHNWRHSDEFTEKGEEYDGWCNTCGRSAGELATFLLRNLPDPRLARSTPTKEEQP